MERALKLSAYVGERDRAAGGLLADGLLDLYERANVRTSVMLRGIEGFGLKHSVHTDRQLTLSEDLPVVAIALDSAQRIELLLPQVAALCGNGLVTLECARLAELSDGAVAPLGERELAELAHGQDALKLTVFVGRLERAGERPAYVAVVDALRRSGAWGASVLFGLDGALSGERARARMLARNARVPLMIISVAPVVGIARALPELGRLLSERAIALERVQVCKRCLLYTSDAADE